MLVLWGSINFYISVFVYAIGTLLLIFAQHNSAQWIQNWNADYIMFPFVDGHMVNKATNCIVNSGLYCRYCCDPKLIKDGYNSVGR